MNKKDFMETTFGDESRNPFPRKGDKDLVEVVAETLPTITDSDLQRYVDKDPELSPAQIELITAALQNDEKIQRKFTELVKKE